MYKLIAIAFIVVLAGGCVSSQKDASSKRSLMVLDQQRDLPKNAKFNNPRYQQKLRKSQKQNRKNNKKAYKRRGR